MTFGPAFVEPGGWGGSGAHVPRGGLWDPGAGGSAHSLACVKPNLFANWLSGGVSSASFEVPYLHLRTSNCF